MSYLSVVCLTSALDTPYASLFSCSLCHFGASSHLSWSPPNLYFLHRNIFGPLPQRKYSRHMTRTPHWVSLLLLRLPIYTVRNDVRPFVISDISIFALLLYGASLVMYNVHYRKINTALVPCALSSSPSHYLRTCIRYFCHSRIHGQQFLFKLHSQHLLFLLSLRFYRCYVRNDTKLYLS